MASSYTLTAGDIRTISRLSIAAAIFSTVLCAFIFLASLWVWSKKHARPILDRISFRLFWWTMGFELAYDVGYIVGETYTIGQWAPASCSVGIYLLMATMGVVNYMCTCIAINLMLIICFGVNPTKRRLERWYIGISIGLGFFIPIIPTALGHFGRDPILEVCWVSARDDQTRMLYLVVDLYLWQLLSCVVATIAVAMTIYSIFKLRRATSKAMFQSRSLTQQAHTESLGNKMAKFDDQFLKTALRISTYPVALIIVNGLISGVDLYISNVGGVHSHTAYVFYCIYYFLYGGRGIFFALLGLFVDPCLRKGMKAAWRGEPATFQPPVTMSVVTEDVYKKSEINSSLLPMVSYGATTTATSSSLGNATLSSSSQLAKLEETGEREAMGMVFEEPAFTYAGRRGSEMSVLAAITQLQPEVDREGLYRVDEDLTALPVPVLRETELGTGVVGRRRGSRKDDVLDGGNEALL